MMTDERLQARPDEQPAKGGRSALVITLGAVVLIAVAVAIALFVLGGDETPTKASARVLAPSAERQAPESSSFTGLESGDELVEGSVVRTDDNGLAELAFDDGSIARIGPESVFTIEKLDADVGHRDIKGNLEVGETWHKVSKLSGSENRYEVDTAVAVAAVRGTTFSVVCAQRRVCDFTVIEGEVGVTLPDGTTDSLRPGETVHVEEGDAGPVRQLSTEELERDPWIASNRTLDAGQQPPPRSSTTTSTTAAPGTTSTTGAAVGSGGSSGGGATSESATAPNRRLSGGTASTTTTSRAATTTTAATGATTTVSYFPESTSTTASPVPTTAGPTSTTSSTSTTTPTGSTSTTTATSTTTTPTSTSSSTTTPSSTSSSTTTTSATSSSTTTSSTSSPSSTSSSTTSPTTSTTLFPSGRMSGTVTDQSTGSPVPDICVLVDGMMTKTGVTGSWALDVPAGTHLVLFSDCRSTPSYAPEYFAGRVGEDDADPVVVESGQTRNGIDATLLPGATISGRVVDEANAPLEGICVTANEIEWETGASSETDATGNYAIRGLAPGNYLVRMVDCATFTRAAEYYNNRLDYQDADLVSVGPGATASGIDNQLVPGGAITGKVFTAPGSPMASACVQTWGPDGQFHSDVTGADGVYQLGGLITGHYVMRFRDCASSPVRAPKYFDNQPEEGGATKVPVTTGTVVSGKDITLDLGGFVSGTITKAEAPGTPLAGACVFVGRDRETASNMSTTSKADGSYRIGPLPPGFYVVSAYGCSGESAGRPARYHPAAADRRDAAPVEMGAGTDRTGTDIALPVAGTGGGSTGPGSISGTVTTAEAPVQPLADVCVVASGPSFASVRTDANGKYTLSGLAAGDYRVRFSDCIRNQRSPEYYQDAPTFSAATPITVGAGAVTGIDEDLALGSTISGRVTAEASGLGLHEICVTSEGPTFASTRTAPDGVYTLRNLAPGSYRIRFDDCRPYTQYIREYYDGQPNSTSATVVTVGTAETVTGKDASLVIGGSISGRVVAAEATSKALPAQCIGATQSGGVAMGALSHSDGTYRIGGLPAGNYTVRFDDCSTRPVRIGETYDDGTNTSVPVTLGSDSGGIDEELVLGGAISGTVTAVDTGLPISSACVSIVDGPTFDFAEASLEGNYVLRGLPAGNYTLLYEDCDLLTRPWAPELHANKRPGVDTPDPVTVTLGGVTDVDAQLEPGGTITGVVLDDSGQPEADICVEVYAPNPADFSQEEVEVQTDIDGRYFARGLPAGDHIIRFSACGGQPLEGEWYDDKPDETTATRVATTPGSTATADAQLAPSAPPV